MRRLLPLGDLIVRYPRATPIVFGALCAAVIVLVAIGVSTVVVNALYEFGVLR